MMGLVKWVVVPAVFGLSMFSAAPEAKAGGWGIQIYSGGYGGYGNYSNYGGYGGGYGGYGGGNPYGSYSRGYSQGYNAYYGSPWSGGNRYHHHHHCR